MKTIEEYKTEYRRLQEMFCRVYISSTEWRKNCQYGYGINSIKKELDMTYTEMVEIVRQVEKSTKCIRGGCPYCPHTKVIKSRHNLTKEEDESNRYEANMDGGAGAFHDSLN